MHSRDSLFSCVLRPKMTTSSKTWPLMFFFTLLSSVHGIQALPYDYSATTECLIEPQRAQYGGGIIANPEFSNGMEGWTVFGQGAIREGISKDGNRYIVAHSRRHSLDSISQKVRFQKGKLYTVSAWIQVSEGSESAAVVFRTSHGKLIHGGNVMAKSGCWSLLKGGVFASFSGPADILFESKNATTEIWVDSVSLQPFTMKQWRSHQHKSIDKARKSKARFKVTYANNTAAEGAVVSVKLTKPEFPFGCGMNYRILQIKEYRDWFTPRFRYTTLTNALKWYSTENVQGQENYTVADALVKFAKTHGISIRGHNIFWDDPRYQPAWVLNLSADELRKAAAKRLNSVVSRHSGQLIAWDVVNENLHFSFFEDKLGQNASAEFFLKAFQLDPKTRMFMNEYNTIEYSADEKANPVNYKKKLEEILSYPGLHGILAGIGLEAHFVSDPLNLAYMRSGLDILGSTGVPIWLTELSVGIGPNQANYLNQILREAYSHPAVQGIIMFAGPEKASFNETVLADKDFKSTPTGVVVDKLIHEWKSQTAQIKTDREGYSEVSLLHGDYDVTVKHPGINSFTSKSYKLTKDVGKETFHVRINA